MATKPPTSNAAWWFKWYPGWIPKTIRNPPEATDPLYPWISPLLIWLVGQGHPVLKNIWLRQLGWWVIPNMNGKMQNWWQPNHQPVKSYSTWWIISIVIHQFPDFLKSTDSSHSQEDMLLLAIWRSVLPPAAWDWRGVSKLLLEYGDGEIWKFKRKEKVTKKPPCLVLKCLKSENGWNLIIKKNGIKPVISWGCNVYYVLRYTTNNMRWMEKWGISEYQ